MLEFLSLALCCGIWIRFGVNGATSVSIASIQNWCQHRFDMGDGRVRGEDIPIRWCSPAALRRVTREWYAAPTQLHRPMISLPRRCVCGKPRNFPRIPEESLTKDGDAWPCCPTLGVKFLKSF